MKLYYPVKPAIVNQSFGANPEYYSRFKDSLGNPYKGHMGIDFNAPHGTPVYCPSDGKAQFARDSHGGEGIYVYVNNYTVILWHLIGDTDSKYPSPFPLNGSLVDVKAGQLLGYADNTGAPFESTGDHLHLGVIENNSVGQPLNPGNGYGGGVDPNPFFNGIYAEDIPKVVGLYQSLIGVMQKLINLLKP